MIIINKDKILNSNFEFQILKNSLKQPTLAFSSKLPLPTSEEQVAH